MKRNDKNNIRLFQNNIFMLKKLWKYSPLYIIVKGFTVILEGLINSYWTVFTVVLLNAVDESKNIRYILFIVLTTGLIYLIWFALRALIVNRIEPLLINKMQYGMHKELFEKALSLDISCYDNPDFYNDYVWAMTEADIRAVEIVNSFGKIAALIISSGVTFSVIFSVNVFVAFILCINAVATVFIQLYSKKIYVEEREQINPLERKREYINRAFFLSDHAKELRISDIDICLYKTYDDANSEIINIKQRYGSKKFICWGIFNNIFDQIAYFGCLIIMIYDLLSNSILIGAFAGAMGAVLNLKYCLSDFIYYFTDFREYSESIEKYMAFLNYKSKIISGDLNAEPFESLTLQNVSFEYDNGKKVLENINMEIRKGERIALVGYNGAGKSTLVKLLLRFYDPTCGRILYNEKPVSNYNIVSYRDKFGTVFQDYKLFAVTLAENVTGDKYNDSMKNNVINSLELASFSERLKSLPKGIDTPVYREFESDGIEFSGGEAQKIAIARMFAKHGDIIIMDEPSSALDPEAEDELNRAVLDNSNGNTVIIISHRLSTTKNADRIYMFDMGEIIEKGTHDELMKQNGKYAEMFNTQARKYK